MNWIVYSLKGEDPVYNLGFLRNLQTRALYYPAAHWAPLLITNFSTIARSTEEQFLGAGLESIDIRDTRMWDVPSCHLWRFAALDQPRIVEDPSAVVIFRDADSRPNEREAACVDCWVRHVRKPLHTIKDHPLHTAPVMLGLFGIKIALAGRELIDDIFAQMARYLRELMPADAFHPNGTLSDQVFVRECLWKDWRNKIWVDDFRHGASVEDRQVPGWNQRLSPAPFDGPFIGERVFLDKNQYDIPEQEARRLRAESFKGLPS